jgi:probable F420-dependent oxidoreductase
MGTVGAMRPFRFGLSARPEPTPGGLREQARWAELNGFSTLLIADHLVPELLDPMPALAAAATATTTLRVGTLVINNDFRHPAMLAREAITVDALSGGRFELGIGAGHMQSEYDAAGIPFDRGRARVDRLAESVRVLRPLLAGEACTVEGEFYQVRDLSLPAPTQSPHIPLHIGGNGPRLLRLAAEHADTVGLVGFRHVRGGREVRLSDFAPEALDRQVVAVRDAARGRDVELSVLVQTTSVTDTARSVAADVAARFGLPDADAVLASPYVLIGSVESLTEKLQSGRERFGVSYPVVFEARGGRDLVPVVARLGGT